MIIIELEGLEQVRATFDTKFVNKAARMAVREAAKDAKIRSSELIRQKWNIKKRDLERKFTITPSGPRLRRLTISGAPIGVSYFDAKEVRVSRLGKGGVAKRRRGKDGVFVQKFGRRNKKHEMGLSVKIFQGGKRTTLRRAWMSNVHSFAGKAKGGATLYGSRRARVLKRFGSNRNNIFGPKSISVPSMFSQGNIQAQVITSASNKLNNRFRHHLARFMAEK